MAAGYERMVFKDPAIKDDVIELPIKHALHVIWIFEELGLNQDIFPVRLWPRLRVLWVNDDCADHATCHMLDHWRSPAMVEKHAGLLGHKGVADGFIGGVDRPV